MSRINKIFILLCCLLVTGNAFAKPYKAVKSPVVAKHHKVKPDNIESNNIIVTQSSLQSTITIPFAKEKNAAIFIRGNKLWVIFNKYKKFTYNQIPVQDASLLTQKKHWINSITQLQLDQLHTYLVFDLAEIGWRLPSVKVSKSGWQIELSNGTSPTINPINIISKPYAIPYPMVAVDVGQEINLIDYIDPYVGDSMIAIPVKMTDKAIPSGYNFVDFKILSSTQGVVIERTSDNPLYSIEGDKLYIGFADMPISPTTLKITSPIIHDKLHDFIRIDQEHHQKILGIKFFMMQDKDFGYETYLLNQELQYVSPKDKVKVYADFALLYIANQLYKEATVMVKIIRKLDFTFANSYKILLMGAIASFMDRSYDNAFQMISKIDAANIPLTSRNEIRLWQGVIASASGNNNSYFISNDAGKLFENRHFNFLSGYTPDILFKLAEVIMNEKIENHHIKEVEQILAAALALDGIDQRAKNRIYYLAGKYYIMQNNETLANKYLDDCISDIADPFNRTLCRFEQLKYQFKKSQINITNAINTLEQLSYIWKGDQLQVNILQHLGDLYNQDKQYIKALHAWQRILTDFPNSMTALKIRQNMVNTFTQFFFEKQNEKMDPLATLALFYQYHNLIPLGDVGNQIVIKFTDYLVHFDLLDQAISILSFQINNRFSGFLREESLNKLAKLEILNQQPKAALETLSMADPNFALPDYLMNERKYLKARALYLIHNYDEALALLHGDESETSDDIQANIYWNLDNWQKFNNHSEPYLYSIANQSSMLTNEQVVRVAKQAVSYIMIDRRDLLKQLYETFKNRMPNNEPYASVIKMLTEGLLSNPNGIITHKDISHYKAIVANLVNAK